MPGLQKPPSQAVSRLDEQTLIRADSNERGAAVNELAGICFHGCKDSPRLAYNIESADRIIDDRAHLRLARLAEEPDIRGKVRRLDENCVHAIYRSDLLERGGGSACFELHNQSQFQSAGLQVFSRLPAETIGA